MGDLDSIPGLGRSPGEGNGYPPQYFCLENPMDRGTWQATVYAFAKIWTRLSNFYSLTQRYCYPYCAYHLRISQPSQLNLFKALSHLDWEQLWALLSPSFQFIITPYAKSLLIPSSFLHLCCHHPSPRHHHSLPELCSYLIILLHTSLFPSNPLFNLKPQFY